MKLTYDEISPITGNLCVLLEEDANLGECRLCMESGYHNYEIMNQSEEDLLQYEENAPQIIKDTVHVDDRGRRWYKMLLTNSLGALYPDVYIDDIPEYGIPDRYVWKVTMYRDLREGEEVQPSMISTLSPDRTTVRVLDDNDAEVFGEYQFDLAMHKFQEKCQEIWKVQ